MHFIDVGQGDCTLIECDGEYMLIDAGDIYKGSTVQLYLTKHNIDKLKYVVGTHPDDDHIGGLDVIITKYPIDTLFMPAITSDTKAYMEVLEAMDYKSLMQTVPDCDMEYKLGSATITFLSPSREYSDDNNNSIVTKITHGNNTFLLTGDAEYEAESYLGSYKQDMLLANVLKVGHHGSSSASSESFIDAVSPAYAVISCGKENKYGHPHQEVLDRLKNHDVAVFRTDEQGSIICTSDGKNLFWSVEPSTTWQAGSTNHSESSDDIDNLNTAGSTENPATFDVISQEAYVLNTNTHKFHNPSCSSVLEMKQKNRRDITASREEIIGMGYAPCKRCNP